jgi:hypothetical protein
MNKQYSINIDGESVTFEFKDSLIHSEGESAGNIDAIITTNPILPQNQLLDELHIKIPGSDEYLYIYGYGVVENSLKATFNSSAIVDAQNLPETVDVYWGAHGEQFIGEMCCQPYSEKTESELSEEIIDAAEPEVEVDKDIVDETNIKQEVKETVVENSSANKISLRKLSAIVSVILLLLGLAFYLSF